MVPTLRLCVVFGAFTVGLASVITSNQKSDNFELLILHNNDMHARFEQTSQLSGVCSPEDREANKCYGGFPRVAHVVKEARKAAENGSGPPVLYLNAGDTYTGTAWFTIYKWKIAAECINALKPDAVSLGNHEFDNGVSGLTPFIEKLTSPVLAANLILTHEEELKAEPNLKNHEIFNINGTKVGVIGYLTPETKVLAVKNNVQYIDEIIALKKEVLKLKAQDVNIIIALGHSGFEKDLEIAKKVDGLDLVIGGHTNTFLWNGTSPDSETSEGPYPTTVTQKSGKRVLVVQAYAYTKYLGKLYITFDSKGEIVTYHGRPILLDNAIPKDPDVLRIITSYRKDVLNITEKVIGTSEVALEEFECHKQECALGNMIADGMVDTYATDVENEQTDATIAIIQSGGIRSSITHFYYPCNITGGDILTVLPFGGFLAKVSMSGIILKEMLEHSVADYHNRASGAFLSYSGIKVVYDLSQPPGSRVVEAMARCSKCGSQYEFIRDLEIYKVLMPYFIAVGGDGYSMLKDLPSVILKYNEYASTNGYIRRRSPMHPKIEGRVTFIDEHEPDVFNSTYRHTSPLFILITVLLYFKS